MNFTKKLFATVILVFTLFMTGCGQMNLGTIDINKVEDTPQMKAIREEGAQKMQELQDQLLKDTQGKSEEEMQKAADEYQRKAMGIGQAYNTQMKHKLDTVIAEIAEAKKLDAVIESSEKMPTVYKGGIDVTDEVVQKLQ